MELQQTQRLAEELQDILDQDEIQPGRLDTLGLQLTEAEEEKATHEGSYQELVIAKDVAFKSLRETRAKMMQTDELLKEAEARTFQTREKVARQEEERRNVLREKNAALDSLERVKARNATRSEARPKQLETIENFIGEATKVCARIPINEGENEESLQKKYEKLLRDLVSAEKR